jgi:hypothetical protein
MIDFSTAQPLREAVEALGTKSPIGALLSSAEWELLPVELRERALFSAMVENERFLSEAQRRILQRIMLERDGLGDGRVMERGRFIEELQDLLEEMGYQPDPDKTGSIQDLSSAGRLGLIWQMQIDQAQGHAKWKTGMDTDILDAVPAQELVRDFQRMERRDWPRIWTENGGKFHGTPGRDYPAAPGRMIALKTDPIWAAISRFGTPWPPFDWGSGMGLRNVRRKEAVQLGVIREGDQLKPLTTPFNAGLQASVAGLPDAALKRLQKTFGDRVVIEGGFIQWKEAA